MESKSIEVGSGEEKNIAKPKKNETHSIEDERDSTLKEKEGKKVDERGKSAKSFCSSRSLKPQHKRILTFMSLVNAMK